MNTSINANTTAATDTNINTTNIGCGSMAEFGGHEYAAWTCPSCGQEICWGCSVRCTDDGSGDGTIRCLHCRYEGRYENGGPVYSGDFPWYRKEFPAWVAGATAARCAEVIRQALRQREQCVVDGTATCGGMPCEFHSSAVSFYGDEGGCGVLRASGRADADALAQKWADGWVLATTLSTPTLSGEELLAKLADAFGGYSQIPNAAIAQAAVGHLNNGRLMYQSAQKGAALVQEAAEAILARFEDYYSEEEEVEYFFTSIWREVFTCAKYLRKEGLAEIAKRRIEG